MADDGLMEFMLMLRREADHADFSPLAESGFTASRRRHSLLGSLRGRVAAAAAATVVSLGSLGGVAYAANGASPGDFLYGLDRALEAVGVGNGGSVERIQEAMVLADQGESESSLEHAASVVSDNPGAAAALQAAAERLAAADHPDGHEEVVQLLTYLAENVGEVDGQLVAELAHAIHGDPSGPPDDTPVGPPDGTPGGRPEETPVGPPSTTPVGPPIDPPGQTTVPDPTVPTP